MSTDPQDPNASDQPEELLENLQDIKQLLDDETEDDNIPVLDDAVLESDSEVLDQQKMDLLLGDEWQQSIEQVLGDARTQILEHSHEWAPQQTDELVDALKVRIDAAVGDWLNQMLSEHMEALRRHVLEVLSDEIRAQINNKLSE